MPVAIPYPIPLNKQPVVADSQVNLPVGDEIAKQVISLSMQPYLYISTIEPIIEKVILAYVK